MARKKLELGLIVGVDHVDEAYARMAKLGLTTCQLCSWEPDELTQDKADQVLTAQEKYGIRVSSFWAGYSSGPAAEWNFTGGPKTIGLVPKRYRRKRVAELKRGADFAKLIGATSISTHVGFIYEDPSEPDYPALVKAIREVAMHCRKLGLNFLFETGQETPTVLLRVIEDVDTGNLGINLDPANLILYGKANPVDALEVFGKYVQGVHAKDGMYPTNGRELGEETALGKGRVDFPTLITRLKKLGYREPITIEREITGAQQTRDIKRAIKLLTPVL